LAEEESDARTTATQGADQEKSDLKSDLVESYRAFGLSPKEAAMAADIESAFVSTRRLAVALPV
jgi:hypothetical protein